MSFGTALSGLNAASSQLDVTANNIANVNTTGFKSSRAQFSDVFATSADGGSASIGSGVKMSAVNQQFSQGSIDFTDNNLDFAVSGEGFFVMDSANGNVFTRSGMFNLDRDGFVVDGSLNRLQVYPPTADGTGFVTGQTVDLQLLTTDSAPIATTQSEIGLNLPANQSAPPIGVFDPNDSDSYNFSTSITSYDSLGASHVSTMYFVKVDPAPGPPVVASNTWEQYLYVDGNQQTVGGVPDTTMVFDGFGALTTPATGDIIYDAYDPGNGAVPLNLTFDYSDTTQFGDDFAVGFVNTDGAPSGRLSGLEVDDTGAVAARFTNGQLQSLGQIILATFPNKQGLNQMGDSTWSESFQSGAVRYGVAGTSDFGLIQSGALESSNVNLTEQLVQMISAQRNFEANAQVISTSDAITQQIINIR